MLKTTLKTLIAGCVLAASAMTVHAAKPEVAVVADGLDNPSGLAIQPGTGHIFVASHAGVHRLDPATGTLTAEITGYPEPTDIYGKGPQYPIGPLGLAFMDQWHLVVGDGSRVDGEELVRIYKVGDAAADAPQKEADAVYTLGPIPAGEQTVKGEGNFYGVAVNESAIYVTCNGDDTKGWVARARIKEGKPGKLQLAIATKEATEVDAPGPVTFSAKGGAVIVGQIGEVNQEGDSLITFYNAKGELQRKIAIGLNDVAGLAYSPSGKLYATDFSWVDATKGGLFHIMLKQGEEKARLITNLDKPTAIVFDADGNAFVAVFGTKAEGSEKPAGQILKVSGL